MLLQFPTAISSNSQALRRAFFPALFCALLCGSLAGFAATPRIALYQPGIANAASSESLQVLRDELRTLGYPEVMLLSASEATPITNPVADLLLLLDAGHADQHALDLLEAYRRQGKDLLIFGAAPAGALGAPRAWTPTPRKLELAREAKPSETMPWDAEHFAQWGFDSSQAMQPKPFSLASGESGKPTLRYECAKQPAHALLISPEWKSTIPFELTIVEARATGPIKRLFVEWESDTGERWTTQLPLQPEWTRYVIEPEDFKPLQQPQYGEPLLKFDPAHARRFKLGIAMHGAEGIAQPQSIEVRAIELARRPASVNGQPPVSLFPLELAATSAFLPFPTPPAAGEQAPPADASAFTICGLRPRALGVAGSALGRWIPWLAVPGLTSGKQDVICASWIDRRTTTGLPLWSHVGLNPSPANRRQLHACLQPILTLTRHGILLLRGGMEQFHYEPGQPLRFGADFYNRNAEPCTVELTATLQPVDGSAPPRQMKVQAELPSRKEFPLLKDFPASQAAPGDYRFALTVTTPDGVQLEKVEHRFSISAPAARAENDRIAVHDSHFTRGGKPWAPHGVHYFLPYVANQPDPRLWHNWLEPQLYDPDLAERDLQTMAEAGVNSIVVPYRHEREASSLRDFLFRCERNNIKCMVYLENAHPLKYDLPQLAALLDAAALDRQPSVFAFDLAWEPHLGNREDRVKLDAAWTRWVVQQYGSIAAAEKIWGFQPAHTGDVLAGPDDQQITETGTWNVMVAAYRRFIDDQISLGYGAVTRLLRQRCPGVLLGVRTGYGGTGAKSIDDRFPFDLVSGADHLDYISPESYGLAGDWSGFLDGKLLVALARYAGRDAKPVVWMEYGHNALGADARALEKQRSYITNLFRVMRETQSSGSFAWWWQGGYRYAEISDYGLTDIEGTPRPALLKLVADAKDLQNPGKPKTPDRTLPIDRDLHPRGLSMIIERARKQFLEWDAAGHTVAFISPAAGQSTDNVDLTGVGNVPPQSNAPLKFVNGEFTNVQMQMSDGAWQAIESGAQLKRTAVRSPLRLRVGALNTGVAAWAADAQTPGGVIAEVSNASETVGRQPLAKPVAGGAECQFELPLNAQHPAGEFTLRLTSQRTGPFGQPFHLSLSE
jgi:hypothetical protein